jgi:hypothetical protein
VTDAARLRTGPALPPQTWRYASFAPIRTSLALFTVEDIEIASDNAQEVHPMSADTASPAPPDQGIVPSTPPRYPVPAWFGQGEWALMAVPTVICVVMLVVAMVL